jgi:dihydroorotase
LLGIKRKALLGIHLKMLIRNGHLIDPSQNLDGAYDVLLENGLVAEIAPQGKLRGSSAEEFDAQGMTVTPGFVDIHVHLREPGQFYKETIASGTLAAAKGGFTSVCAMPNTVPVNDSPAITRWMQDPERQAAIHVFPIAAATVGSLGERLTDFVALRRAGAVAVTDDGKPILQDEIMRQSLVMASRLGMPVVQHAEDTRMTSGASMNAGPAAFRLGLRGWPVEAETSIVRRDIELAAQTKAHLHVAHVSAGASVEAVREAKSNGVHVTCEVTPHHFALLDEDIADYDSNFKMNPPLRGREDRDALIAGLLDGTVDCIATDHAPHAHHEKNAEFDRAPFGITGLESALGLCLSILHEKHKMPLQRLVELLTTNPAKVMGLEGRGTLAPGSHADVTIFDPKKKWKYQAAASLSKSKNSPFDGWAMQGRIVATICNGSIVWKNGVHG